MPLNDESLQELESTLGPGADNGLTSSLDIASKRNPDQYAEVMSLAEKSGLPPSTVETEHSEIKRREGLRSIDKDKLGETNPILAEYLRNPDNASVSYDDIEVLRGIEDTDRKIGRVQTATGKLYQSFVSGFTSTGKAHAVETGQAYSISLDMMNRIAAGEELPWYAIKSPRVRAFEAASPTEREEMIREVERKLDPRQYSSWKNAEAIDKAVEKQIEINPEYAEEFLTGKLPEGFGSMFSFMTVAAATRGAGVRGPMSTVPTSQFAAEQMRGTSFEEALNSGATFEQAFQAANLNSLMGYSEALPIARMFDRFDKSGGGQLRQQLTAAMKAGTEEAIQEFSQQLWSNMVASDIVKYDPDRKMLEDTGEGVAVGFTVGALTQFVGGLITGGRRSGPNVDRSTGKQIEDAAVTLEEQEALDQLISLSQSSTTRERAQDKFNGFLKALQHKEVIIPADVVESLENAPDAMTAQLDGTGGDVSIPMDTFTNDIATDEALMSVIRPHLKMTHEAKTLSELESDPEGIVQRLVKRAVEREETQTESDRIYQEVKDQLVATGRQSEETARLSASIYPAMVDRISEEYGLTPAEVYERIGLRGIVGPDGRQATDEAPEAVMETARQLNVQTAAEVQTELRERYSNLKIDFSGRNNKATLSRIVVPEDQREIGVGTQVMTDIVSWADQNNTTVALTPSKDFGGNVKRLKEFYKRFGFVENKGRNKDFEISESMYREPQERTLRQEDAPTDTPEFEAWSGGGEIVESEDINDHSFQADAPVVLKVFHGTTHEFSVFDALRGNLEGQFGAINYFTSSEHDADVNYAGEGPDLTNRIEQRKEQIQSELDLGDADYILEDFPMLTREEAERAADSDIDTMGEIAERLAREELAGGQEQVMELYVKVENPFVIGEDSQWMEFIDDEQVQSEAIEQVADNNGVEVSEVEADLETYEDEIDEARWEIQDQQEHPLVEAINTVADRYDVDASTLAGEIYELGEGATQQQIEELLRSSEDYAYAEDPETGTSVQSQMIAEVIQELGYDSIILKDAEQRFENMDMEPGTTHVHIFDSGKTNIKSVQNIGAFDPSDPDIFKQTTRGELALYADDTRLMRLTEASDLSTFLHESAHLFLELEKQLAAEFGTTENQDALLEWLEVESFEDIETEQHEKFAETFEVYLREGKAPSLRLRDAFAAFSRWLTRIYKRLTDPRLRRAELNPEITEVMDRMLATQAEIEEAMANPAYDEFFRSKEQAGMTDAEWEKYQKQQAKRKDKAEQDLNEKLVKELTKRKTAEWNEEKAPIVEEETERLNKEPVYQLRGDLANFPMDYELLKDAVGFDKLPGKLIGKARKEDGVDPFEYAEAYGYKSVQDMYDDLIEAPSIKEAANAAAEARMVEKYGDILNDGSIEQEAREAVHNDVQAELLLMELKALGRKTGKTEINRDYLKAEAKRMISTMTFSEMKPTKFYNAEIRAAKKAVTATDDNLAYQAKVQQIVNHYLYREAVDTKRRMERQRKYVRNVQNRKYKSNDVGAEYIQNMKTLANLYDMSTKKDQDQAVSQILEWYEAQLADENQLVQITLLDEFLIRGLEAKRTGQLADLKFPKFDELTVSQMHGLYEMLRHLRFVGGKMSDGEKAKRTAEREKLGESIIDHGGKDMPGTRGIPSDAALRRRKWSHMVNKLPSMRNMARKLDGFIDDGEAFNQLYTLIEKGGNEKVRLRREVYERFESEMGAIHEVGLSRKDNDLKTYTLESGMKLDIHSEARFMMALYWGNESAREAIRQGFGVTDRDVLTILSDMTNDQLELVNTTWKVNESMWPDLSAASVRQYGVAPPKLDPTPFTVNDVEMTGGHMRLFYDSTTIELSNDRDNSGSYASIMPTKAGSLHSRVGSGGKPPLLDKNNITRAMEDNIHFVAFADVGSQLRGMVNSDEIRGAIEQKHGQGFYQAFIESIDSITGNRAERESIPQLSSMFRLLRRAATAKHLMYSVRNTVQQLGAIPVATDEVGTVAWFGALARYSSDNTNFTNFVNDRSEFMRDRASLVNREAAEYLRSVTVDSKTAHLWSQFERFGFTPQTIVDAVVAYPVWMAKYEQGMEQHGDDKRAVSDADTAVAESVGSGSDLHLGQVFHSTNTEWVRTFTMFGSWFNAYYQRIYRDIGRYRVEPSMQTTHEAMRTLITTPFIVAVASAALIMDGPDDEEGWLEWASVNYAKFMAGTVPLLRDVASFTFEGFSPKTVWSGGAEAPARFANELQAYHDGKQTALKTVVDISKVGTTIIPVPGSGNAIRVADYIDSANQGKETDKGWFLNSYQAITEGPDK